MREPVVAVNPMATPVSHLRFVSPPSRAPIAWSCPWPRLLPALTTALLLSLCHFTILPISSGWFAWVALVPLLCLVRSDARPRRIYMAAWAGGLAFFFFVLQWMRVADPRMYYTWAMLATWCSLFVPLGLFLIRRLDRRTRLPLVVTVPVVWTGLEFIRAHLLTGFAWYFLGHTQHEFLPVIQIADLGGAYAVTFVVAAVNAMVFELLFSSVGFRRAFALPEMVTPRRPGWIVQVLAVTVLVAATLGYGAWRLHEDAFQSGPRVALVQGSVPQGIRNSRHDAAEEKDRQAVANKIAQDYLALHAIALHEKPDMIVWPETSYPADWQELSQDDLRETLELARRNPPPEWQGAPLPTPEQWQRLWLWHWNKEILREAMAWPTTVLLGLNCEVQQGRAAPKRFNSAVMLDRGGAYGGRYDKIHCVPFGEYVPLRDWIPAMSAFAPYDHDYSVETGEQLTRFALGSYRFGVLICFEDSDSYLARQFLHRSGELVPCDVLPQVVTLGRMYSSLPRPKPGEPPIDFLVNISNDGWFDGTAEHEEHLAICRFRAVECRRSMVRAVNMGISAVIDGNGRVLAPTATRYTADDVPVWVIDQADGVTDLPRSRWAEFKKVAGVLTADVPIDIRTSFYARWGDWLPASCWLVVAGGLLLTFRRRPN